MKRKLLLLSLLGHIVSCSQSPENEGPIYLDVDKPVEERVEDALARMTLEEKVKMTHAQSKFSSPGVPRLGIPEVWCTDGPHGIRPEVYWDDWDMAGWTNDSCTVFPALTALAATWNEDLSHLYGISIGEEAKYRNKSVLLGPGVNICRFPLLGRNFEYMGEDPYLASRLAVPYVKGVQEKGVAACVKHFAINNNETNRVTTNCNVDERTLHEIYLPAFKAAVQEGDAWAIMGSYNQYKGQWNCHNDLLLNDILKRKWKFDGVVISDWGGVHDTEQAVKNGLDLEMGTWTNGLDRSMSNAYENYFLAKPYYEGIRSGKYGTGELDDKCRRILRMIFRTTMAKERYWGRFTCPEHDQAAYEIGAESIVLLKNDGLLPLQVKKGQKVLVVGENAIKKMSVGGGSSSLKAQHEIVPIEGIRAELEGKAEVLFERGYKGDVTGVYNRVVTGQNLSESRSEDDLIRDAVEAARKADFVIFIGGLNKATFQDCEGRDRVEYNLPYNQDKVIEALAEANDKLVVVNISGSPVGMPWADKVPAILQSWYLGSEAGICLADVLVGKVNPSGKLPFSYPKVYSDCPIRTERQYPGLLEGRTGGVESYDVPIYDIYYDEGIFVGYRWYEAQNIEPQFAFGHGLSYTTFEISEIHSDKESFRKDGQITITVNVKNTGKVAGSEVVQLYIQDMEASVERPKKELKGFHKVYLEPGESKEVNFIIDVSHLSFYDPETHSWKAEPGSFVAHVGSGSDKIRQTLIFGLK